MNIVSSVSLCVLFLANIVCSVSCEYCVFCFLRILCVLFLANIVCSVRNIVNIVCSVSCD